MGIFQRPVRLRVPAIAAVSGMALLAGMSAAVPAAARVSSGKVAAGHSGARRWLRFYSGPGAMNDIAESVAVAPRGSAVFVTGQSPSAPGVVDYATVGYSAATGKRLWASRYGGATSAGGGFANAVAAGPGGRVFVTGGSPGSGTGLDYVTIAYSAATGAQLWLSRYDGPAPRGNDVAFGVAISPDGSTVFVTGGSQGGEATSGDYATVAYDAATGAQLWASRYNGQKSGADVATSLAVGPHGGTVYVTGASAGVGTRADYATVAYNASTGAQRWVSRYNGAPVKSDRAASVAVGPDGHEVYVTGTSGGDFATIAYKAANGAQLWVSRQTHRKPFANGASSLAVGPTGSRLYVTGTVGFDIETVAYRAATGARLWVNRYRGRPLGSFSSEVAVGPRGRSVYVTGITGNDFATIAYNAAAGSRRWVRLYPGAGSALAVSPVTGTVFVTGSTDRGSASRLDYATIAYHG